MFRFIEILFTILLLLTLSACDNQNNQSKDKKTNNLSEPEQTEITQFAYVALAYGKPSVYKYNIDKGNFELFWFDQSDFVVALVTNYSTNISFFVTAKKVGEKGNFPFISKIELYRIDSEISKVDFIDDIGDAMQVNAYWNEQGNFELVYTDIDKTISSYINKFVLTFNSYGKLIDKKLETFDLTKSGFPLLLPKKSSSVSVSGWYGISEINDSVYLKISDGKDRFITSIKGNISEAGWDEDEDFLFFSTSGIKTDFSESGLFVYNIEADSIVTSWTGEGRKDFFTADDLLIFEDGLGENSNIVVYNFRKAELVNTFTRKGGSGLKNIPEKKR
jgi:hypothetical protein